MRTYLLRRILQIIPVMFGITILIFFIVHAAPGDPTTKMMDPKMTVEEKIRLKEKFGVDKPVIVQYADWITEVMKGNLGFSWKFQRPVAQVMGERMLSTFYLAIVSLLLALLVGIPAGVISATRQYTGLDYFFTIFALIGISIPSFFFALLLIKFFAIDQGIFPISGMRTPGASDWAVWEQVKDVSVHTVLPAIVLGLGSTASFMRYTRSSMLEVIRQDYIRTARSKGLSERVVIYKHALRNALIPIITLLGFWIPGLFSGALIVEQVFAWPGMGLLGYQAVTDRDYPLLMGVNLFLAFLTLIGNLLADLFYGLADPRIKYD
ncbi:ABC transporter permease [Fusibacter sp. 3D3]|uniref:ABC transporter permease n=1 Tax=Fusibacter sp. 3D3 TaxID=1048380 RepID=UPI00085346F9|nr:ABC transporter permease [Fusibacter sp. 3D3]GAU79463.1 oligopeptide transport system permease protein OppB [Fusibacter sp. 3D3]